MSKHEITEAVRDKWAPILESEDAPKLHDAAARARMLRVLETSERTIKEEVNTGSVSNWDPILITMLRRTQPSLMGNNWLGVQPMTGPTGLIFVMRTHYIDKVTGARTETWTQTPVDATKSGPMSTATAEHLGSYQHVNTGDAGGAQDPVVYTAPWQEMDFTIEKTDVSVNTRALKARYTNELAQDLKNIHGLNAEAELSTILSTEIVAEQDREFLAMILSLAVDAGTFDLDGDTDGRWMVEKYKGLIVKIEKEANKIARGTRRGKGNWIITSANVAGALNVAGKIDTNFTVGSFEPNTVGMAFVGTMAGFKVFIDPYAVTDYVVVGYKGASAYDAGLYYCPYVPLEFYRAIGQEDFNPRIGFKTRYGLKENPFGQYDGTAIGLGSGNQYYRKFTVTGL